MSQISSQTAKKIAKRLKRMNDEPEFVQLVNDYNKARDLGGFSMFRNLEDLYKVLMTEFTKIVGHEDCFGFGFHDSKKLGLFHNAFKFNIYEEERHVRPKGELCRTSTDGILYDFYEVSFNSLYPTLLSNAINNRSLMVCYDASYSFEHIYTALVGDYMNIRRYLYTYEVSTMLFKIFVNYTFGYMSNPNSPFRFHETSRCPIKAFHRDMMSVIKDSNLFMHYNIDEFYVKSEHKDEFIELIMPVLKKHGVQETIDVDYYDRRIIESWLLITWYCTPEFRKEESKKRGKHKSKKS